VNEPEETGPNWFRDLEEIAVELESEVGMHGPTHVQLIDLVRGVKDERDRLRADLEAGRAQWVKEAKHAARRIGECNRERDRLRAVVEADDGPVAKTMEYLGQVEAERDRLRAVVDAAHELLDEDRTSWSPEHQRLAEALAALDGSADMGEADS
jgi:hypothetical protein